MNKYDPIKKKVENVLTEISRLKDTQPPDSSDIDMRVLELENYLREFLRRKLV